MTQTTDTAEAAPETTGLSAEAQAELEELEEMYEAMAAPAQEPTTFPPTFFWEW